jgi:hypothetical protein
MTKTLRIGLRLLTASLLTTTLGAAPILAATFNKAPPKSDGSSGSFDALFGNGEYMVAFDTDNGNVVEYIGGGDTVAFTVPHKTITYNGRSLPAYEFSSFNVEPSVSLTIVGTAPAVFLSQGNMNIAGQFKFANTPVAGGTISTGVNGNYDGGAGAGVGGGGGGEGPGGGASACVSVSYTGSGGGGGGNYSKGGHGLKNYEPSDAGNQVVYPGGLAGFEENTARLQGGGGGGAPGGGNANGEYWGGQAGGNGGGAVVFSTPGTITITSSGVIDASGIAGQTNYGSGNPGYSGGGAAGDQWFFAKGGFTNAGQMLLHGGAGGAYRAPETACGSQKLVNGPDGGEGSGGVLMIVAPTIANSGGINLSGGNGASAPSGGLLNANGVAINNSGTIVGARTTE